MGFQFNHVGGGTKTRRPIALQMQYHPGREQPTCYLHTGDGERQLSLAELQEHIERENQRLAHLGTFATEEIVVRIEYKYCPNLSIVDTPGLLATATAATPRGATEAELLPRLDAAALLSPMAASAGSAQQQPSPVGSTQPPATAATPPPAAAALLAADVEELVLAKMRNPSALILCVEETNNWEVAAARAIVARADPGLARTVVVSTKLDTKFAQFGAPPELRAFLAADPLRRRHPGLLGGPFFTSVPAGRVGRTDAHHFRTNGGFQGALVQQEAADAQYVQAVLPGLAAVGAGNVPSIGVSSLRRFLEGLLRERYVRSLRSVVPQLQQADAKLNDELGRIDVALDELTSWRAQAALRSAVDRFAASLEAAVKGVSSPAAHKLGQRLAEEHAESGVRFTSIHDTLAAPVPDSERRLFGGAQYYRVMNEFREAVHSLPTAPVPAEEVMNAMGFGVDELFEARSASAIALQRCVEAVRPLLVALLQRLQYVLERMLVYVEATWAATADDVSSATPAAVERVLGERLWHSLAAGFRAHLAECAQQCLAMCLDDLGDPGHAALLGCGPTLPRRRVAVGPAARRRQQQQQREPESGLGATLVGDALVHATVAEWKQRVCEAVTRKVHADLLLRLVDSLPDRLLQRVEEGFEGAAGFDLETAREHLHGRREQLSREQLRVSRMLLTFQRVARVYAPAPAGKAALRG